MIPKEVYISLRNVDNIKRCFFSRKTECSGKCEYCFGKWDKYLKIEDEQKIEDGMIIYPNCDGNAFDENWESIEERIKKSSKKNIIVSISTKFDLNEDMLDKIVQLNNHLRKNGGMIKISVSFSCGEEHMQTIENGTASYTERIQVIRKIIKKKIPYFTIIKPILPFIEFGEYMKIIDDTFPLCPNYVLGDLYIDKNEEFYTKYIMNRGYNIKKRDVSWNGENGEWDVVESNDLKESIEKYIVKLGGRTFKSDKEAIQYIEV